MRNLAPCILLVAVLVVALPAHSAMREVSPVFVASPPSLVAACHATAKAVGYRVPCPMRIPVGLTATGRNGPTPCSLHIIGPAGTDACAQAWRGWVVGSSTTRSQHLVITASPTALTNAAKVVNGPAWYPQAKVRLLRALTIRGWHVKAVYAPPATNDGSAFAHHVVLIWTVAHHTYAVGFHDVSGMMPTLQLDERLVRSIKLLGS
jgi:hypothetical protein